MHLAKFGTARLRSRWTAFLVAFSVVVQLFAVATPPALTAPALAGANEATVAAELKAAFGDAAELCAHINDHGAPGKHAPCGNCCDQCPLCRAASQTVALVLHDPPALPERLDSDAHAIRTPRARDVPPAYPAQPNPARAPPLDV
jgi:hypothetical protein